MKSSFTVEGMSCASCSAHVENAVSRLSGVKYVSVNLLNKSMSVEHDETVCSEGDICNAVKKAGYSAFVKTKDEPVEIVSDKEDKTLKKKVIKLVSSIVLLLVLMYFAMGEMLSIPVPGILSKSEHAYYNGLVQMVLSLAIILINMNFYINGFKQLFSLSPGMDTLIALGSGISFSYSIYILIRIRSFTQYGSADQAFLESGYLYFESAAMILTLISVGKLLEERSRLKTRDSISKLIKLRPYYANLLSGNTEKQVPVEQIDIGEQIVIRSGETIPLDGYVISGNATVDESMLTGESILSDKSEGSNVFQATVCQHGYMIVSVSKRSNETVLSQIIEKTLEAAASKAPVQRLADRISAVFVPIVIGISILVLILWLINGYSFNDALNFAISVLVVSCPCSLGLATPTAIMAGTGKGAEMGILIKSAEILELTHKIDTVVLDKTGTVTVGKLKVTDCYVYEGIEKSTFLKISAALEGMSEHPVAKAIVNYTGEADLKGTEYEYLPGGGIKGKVEGRTYIAGNKTTIEKFSLLDSTTKEKCDALSKTGKTVIAVASENNVLGIFGLSDTLKPSAGECITQLKQSGINCVMLTGDNELTANVIAESAGIDEVKAGLTPIQKVNEIERLKSRGKIVAMVGDGINDAPALTGADIGFAIGSGTDIAVESADVVLTGSSLGLLWDTIRLSKATMRTIKQNLFWAFFYNILGIPVAAGALYGSLGLKLNPMICAALMSCSSIFVVTNALRLRYFHSTSEKREFPESKMNIISNEEENKGGNAIMEVKVIIEGMMCMHCSGHVEKAFNTMEGIECHVELEAKTAFLKLTKDYSDDELKQIVKDAGYEPVSVIR